MRKTILPILSLVVLLVIASAVHAQTPSISVSTVPSATPTGTIGTVQSDFAKDVQDGKKETANDQQAQQNQKDELSSENVSVNEDGQIQNGQLGDDQQDMTESQNELNQEGDNNSASQSDGETKDDNRNGNQNTANPTGSESGNGTTQNTNFGTSQSGNQSESSNSGTNNANQ